MAEHSACDRLDLAVKQATWKTSAFGHPAELRRIWASCLAKGRVPDDLHRWILSCWARPLEDGPGGLR